MKKFFLSFISLLMLSGSVAASEPITLKQVASGEFAAERVSGINPIKGTDQYASISADGKRIEEYSFKTGKRTAVLFDVDNTQGEKITAFDGYIMSPEGTRMLISTKRQPVYRRSYKAEFYIYTIKSRKLEKLSDGGPQQCPIWSPDGLQVAFVRDNNIFLVKLLYDNAENQVTKDGKFNEVINGIPDWVNEEEFEFNTAMTFNADGTMLCWLRYNEKDVKQYSLQLYKGSHPERKEYAEYPGLYSYKYPKAGTDNAKVTAWSYDIKSHRIQQLQVPVDADGYMPRIKSTPNADKVLVYTMPRHQDGGAGGHHRAGGDEHVDGGVCKPDRREGGGADLADKGGIEKTDRRCRKVVDRDGDDEADDIAAPDDGRRRRRCGHGLFSCFSSVRIQINIRVFDFFFCCPL